MEVALPRSVAKYLAGLPAAQQHKLGPLLNEVNLALTAGAGKDHLLALLTAHPVPEPAAEVALVEALARFSHPLIPVILQACFGGTAQRNCQKALKKAFHILQTRGVKIPLDLMKPDDPKVFKPVTPVPQIKTYTSRIDINGSRMIIVQLPRQGQSFNLLVALCNDLEGLKDAYALLMSNKEVKKYLAATKEDIPGELIELPPAYAYNILEASYQVNPDHSSESVAAYLKARPLLANLLGQEEPPDIRNLLPALANREDYLSQSQNLCLEEEFLNWHFLPEDLNPWLTKIREIEQSPLVLTPDQKVGRIEDTVAEALKALATPEKRRLLSRRLLEMAYYFDQIGKPHLARLAQAAGEDLDRDRSPLERENPFLLGLLMFPLRGMYDQEKNPEQPDFQTQGRILTDLKNF